MLPYRIVARSSTGDRRVFYARKLRLLDGWVEADGSFRGATRPRLKIRLPMTSVLYIEETSRGPLRHGWVKPRLDTETPRPVFARALECPPAVRWRGHQRGRREFRH